MTISPETTRLVAAAIAGVLSGGGTYAFARALFAYLAYCGVAISPRRKRILVLPICAVIALAALALQVGLGIAPLTPDGLLLAMTVAFTASQMFHAGDLSTKAA